MHKILKSSGSTSTERYLAKVCESTFLSLWSYPNLYTSEGRKNSKGAGKELCDLLVVFGNHIIIFSDKEISFNPNADLRVAWNRWHKKAIGVSANQLFGAEKWIKEKPTEIYLDKYCTQRFPFEITITNDVRFHLIAMTTGSCGPAKSYFGGRSSGSLLQIPAFSNELVAENPFVINDIDPSKTFIHVFDEIAFEILFDELDTTRDFVSYLSAKEDAIRRNKFQAIAGEEDLVAYYMLNGGLVRGDPFDISDTIQAKKHGGIALAEGFWADYVESPERKMLKEANRVSYFWDDLIENFARHILQGTVAIGNDKHIITHEQAIRWMAAEGRLARRMLSEQFLDKMHATLPERRSSRVCFSPFNEDTCFVFVFYPRDKDENYNAYRKERIALLHAYGLACKFKFPQVKRITLIGTEPKFSDGRSEDVLAMEIDELDADEAEFARNVIEEDNILKNSWTIRKKMQVAPDPCEQVTLPLGNRSTKVGRNQRCPCGSGKKHKKCCLAAEKVVSGSFHRC